MGAKRKYYLNEDYFSKIDSHQKAYWLGFIYAEGNVYKNTLTIKLATVDKYVLDQFGLDLKTNAPTKEVNDRDAFRIRINSKKMVTQLLTHGVFPAKSALLKFPDLDEKYLNSFILGFYDGDGWITSKKDKTLKIQSYIIGFCSCSFELLEKFQLHFMRMGFGKGSFFQRKKIKKRKPAYQLSYSGLMSSNILNWLYKNNQFHILRKYEIYGDMKKHLKNVALKKSSKYRGVCLDKSFSDIRWKSYVQHKGEKIILGFFKQEIAAAKAYDSFLKTHPDIPSSKMNFQI